MLQVDFLPFLLKAKKNTYASGKAPDASSRPGSHDLSYAEVPYLYIDTYLGGFAFVGEEAVWHAGNPIWGMNYYGTMLVPEIPEGFSPFLKQALLNVPLEAPFRGPARFTDGKFLYQCSYTGDPVLFKGEELIYLNENLIYRLDFHGGEIIQ